MEYCNMMEYLNLIALSVVCVLLGGFIVAFTQECSLTDEERLSDVRCQIVDVLSNPDLDDVTREYFTGMLELT